MQNLDNDSLSNISVRKHSKVDIAALHSKGFSIIHSNHLLLWITPEVGNIFSNPFQSRGLIHQSLISGRILSAQVEKPERSKSILHTDNYNIHLRWSGVAEIGMVSVDTNTIPLLRELMTLFSKNPSLLLTF